MSNLSKVFSIGPPQLLYGLAVQGPELCEDSTKKTRKILFWSIIYDEDIDATPPFLQKYIYPLDVNARGLRYVWYVQEGSVLVRTYQLRRT